MIFDTKDEKIEKLNKKITDIERRMETNFQRMNGTVTTLKEIIVQLQKENTQLRSERDFLVERQKKMLKRVPVPDLAGEITEKLVKPAANKIKENVEFIQLIAKDANYEDYVQLQEKRKEKKVYKNTAKEIKDIIDLPKPNHGKSIDGLFEMVSTTGKMRIDEAARKMGVHEVQIEEWAKILEDNDMVTVKKSPLGKMEIVKI